VLHIYGDLYIRICEPLHLYCVSQKESNTLSKKIKINLDILGMLMLFVERYTTEI
jgi:hypothetical protein